MKVARAIRQQCYEHLLRTLKYNTNQRSIFNQLIQKGVLSLEDDNLDKEITKEFNQLKRFITQMNKKLQKKQLLKDSEKDQFLKHCKRKSKLKNLKLRNEEAQKDNSILVPYINSVREPQVDPLHHQFTSNYLFHVPQFPIFKKNLIYLNGIHRSIEDFIMPDTRKILNKHSGMNYDLDQNTNPVSYSMPRKNEVFSVQRQHSMNVITSLKNNNQAVKRQKQAKKVQIQALKMRLHQIKEENLKSQKLLRIQQKQIAKEEMRINKMQIQSQRKKQIIIKLDKRGAQQAITQEENPYTEYTYSSTTIKGEIKSLNQKKNNDVPLLLQSSQDNRIKISLLNNLSSQEQDQIRQQEEQDGQQDEIKDEEQNEDQDDIQAEKIEANNDKVIQQPIPFTKAKIVSIPITKLQLQENKLSKRKSPKQEINKGARSIRTKKNQAKMTISNIKDYFPLKTKQDSQRKDLDKRDLNYNVENSSSKINLKLNQGCRQAKKETGKQIDQGSPKENENLTIQINLRNFNINLK